MLVRSLAVTPSRGIESRRRMRATFSEMAGEDGNPMVNQPDASRLWEHLRVLSEDIGPRLSGTSGDERAVDYIPATLERVAVAAHNGTAAGVRGSTDNASG